ncbi:nicotinamide mononucleotide transporter family protein [Candidatus Cardinium hertigii]|uniref:nicotinamide mononucleotide transporter family protein n=1 Tax=Candidatus Cardinium hertigii TaxID=247481 RepID=UPI003D7E4BC9
MHIPQLLVATIDVVQSLIYHPQRLLEFILVVVSVFAHFLETRQNIWSRILAFPIALTNIYVYSVRQLYGKVIYSIVFIFFNAYAYLRWKGTLHRKPLQVSRISYKMLLSITGLSMLGSMVWTFIGHIYFNKAPILSTYGDTCYMFLGFMDKWLMSHKKLERWVVTIFRYIIFSLACYQKGAIILSIHYLILSVIGIYGQIQWYISYKSMKI